jgi:hypothetical protein
MKDWLNEPKLTPLVNPIRSIKSDGTEEIHLVPICTCWAEYVIGLGLQVFICPNCRPEDNGEHERGLAAPPPGSGHLPEDSH